MATTPLITQAQLERRIGGPTALVRLTDDDGDGIADTAIVSMILAEATSLGVGMLHNGFPSYAQVATLIAHDEAIEGAFCDIAAGLAGARKQEFYDGAGNPMFWKRRNDAEKVLVRKAQGNLRTAGEEQAGTNALIGVRRSRDIARDPYVFQSSSRDRKGPGGF